MASPEFSRRAFLTGVAALGIDAALGRGTAQAQEAQPEPEATPVIEATPDIRSLGDVERADRPGDAYDYQQEEAYGGFFENPENAPEITALACAGAEIYRFLYHNGDDKIPKEEMYSLRSLPLYVGGAAAAGFATMTVLQEADLVPKHRGE